MHFSLAERGACSGGCGTAFKLTPSGAKKYTEKILYSFAGGTGDGAHPRSALLAGKQGAFYGTTSFAGSASHGTIFVITPSGQSYSERVLYAFKGGYNDGSTPRGGMVMDKKQAIYGTTSNGGGSSSLGTVFKLAPSGSSYKETVLHKFIGSPSDGASPYADVIFGPDSKIWGVTPFGGSGSCTGSETGCGVLFTVAP